MTRTPLSIALCALLCAVAGLASACGDALTGHSVRTPVDTGNLEVGNYPVTPTVFGTAGSERAGRVREGQRLAEYVLHGFEIDPGFPHSNWPLTPHVILDHRGLQDWVGNDTFDEAARDIVTGYANGYATNADQAKSVVLVNAVLLFSDDQTAARVSDQLAQDELTFKKENQPIAIPGYPRARASWGPRWENLGPGHLGVASWIPHGRFILNTIVHDMSSPSSQAPAVAATELIRRALDAQIPLLSKFTPTPPGKLAQLPLDEDGMRGHTMPTDPDNRSRADEDSVLGPRGMLNQFDDPVDAQKQLRAAGVDLAAFAAGGTFRARDEAAAKQLYDAWGDLGRGANAPAGLRTKRVGSPPGLAASASCTGPDKPDGSRAGIYICKVWRGRYLAQVISNHVQDVYQRAAAQYVMLGDR